MNKISTRIILLICLFSSLNLYANAELRKYSKCIQLITQNSIKFTDNLSTAVLNGSSTASNACIQILNQTSLNPQGELLPANNKQSIHTLNAFQNLHTSWFLENDFKGANLFFLNLSRAVFDTTNPALYYTRALFLDSFNIKDIFSSPDRLKAKRTNSSTSLDDFDFGHAQHVFTNLKTIELGDLLGIQTTGDIIQNYSHLNGSNETVTGSITHKRTFGGGILGSPEYLNKSIGSTSYFN